MSMHIATFIFYTMAMLGVMFVAFVVYKKFSGQADLMRQSKMKIEDMLRLSQRKCLYVINVDDERFLIASDLDNTTLISKLKNKQVQNQVGIETAIAKKEENPINLYEPNDTKTSSGNVMRNILKELNSRKEL